jgi:hypothetical protein
MRLTAPGTERASPCTVRSGDPSSTSSGGGDGSNASDNETLGKLASARSPGEACVRRAKSAGDAGLQRLSREADSRLASATIDRIPGAAVPIAAAWHQLVRPDGNLAFIKSATLATAATSLTQFRIAPAPTRST